MRVIPLFLIIISFSLAVESAVAIRAITSTEDLPSTILLDSVLLPFSLEKKPTNYIIDVIPSGNIYMDKSSNTIQCKGGESQCYKNLLQYCVIREYSYELSHEFVRCVQTRTDSAEKIYNTCKRFGFLYYDEIDKCLANREAMLMELYHLGQKHMSKHTDTLPQLFYGKETISVEKLVADQQVVYKKLQSRICNLDDNRKHLGKRCNDDYRVLIESIYIQQQEQTHRASRSTQRLVKYSNDVYTPRTLNAFSRGLEKGTGELLVVFDVTHPIQSVVSEIMQLPERFVSPVFLPIAEDDFQASCSDQHCLLYRSLLCGYTAMEESRIAPYSMCLLQAKTLDEERIQFCASTNQYSPSTINHCIKYPSMLSLYQQNVTTILYSSIQDFMEEKTILDLAADEDILLEAEADNEDMLLPDEPEKPFQFDVGSLSPISYFLNSKKFSFKEGSLLETLCLVLSSSSFACTGKKPINALYKPQSPVHEPRVDIFVNILCLRNIPALEPLMNWFREYPSLGEKVSILVDPFVDVLVDINENKEYEFRTTHNHNHIAKAFIASCAVRLLRNPALYWDFVSCINEKEGLATNIANECIHQYGYAVEDLQYCLSNEEYLYQIWSEKRQQQNNKFWATVSPYVFINGNHESRIEMIPKQICQLIGGDDPACSNIPDLEQNIAYCMISPIYYYICCQTMELKLFEDDDYETCSFRNYFTFVQN